MRTLLLSVALATSLFGASIAVGAAAQAEPLPRLIYGVDRSGEAPNLTPVQYVVGGRTFCWYDSAWSGPGFYWCGYAMRRGLGYGGGEGWHGWRHDGHGDGMRAEVRHHRSHHVAAVHDQGRGDDHRRPAT